MEYSRLKQNGTKKGEDIMMNLLDVSTDSDPEPLNLPPLKGKKLTKRKRSGFSQSSQNTSVCDICSFIKVLAVILAISLLALLSVITVMLYQQMGELQNALASVERKNTESTSEIGKFQPQLDKLDEKLNNIQSEEVERLKIVDNQIGKLNRSSLQSSANVQTNDDLSKKLDQLAQIPIISKSVAQIGADVANLKTTIDALNKFKQDADSQLKDLSQKLLQSDDRESKPHDGSDDLAQKLETLQQSVGEMNITVWSKIDSMNTVVTGQQIKFEMLDNKTRQLQLQMAQGAPSLPGDQLQIPDAVQQQIEQKIFEHIHQMVPNTTDDINDPSLTKILSNMDNITSMVKGLKDDFIQLKADHSTMLPTGLPAQANNTQSVALDRLETLNKTVDHLSHDVSALMEKFVQNQNILTSLGRVVEGLKQYVHIMEIKYDKSMNHTERTDDPDLGNLPTPDNFTLTLDEINNKTETVPSTTPRPIIHMQLIKTEKDLNLGLHRWDHNGNGVIDGSELESLPDFMPDPPTPEQMKQFDFDKNGSLDENELKIALGFKDYPNQEERERLADLG